LSSIPGELGEGLLTSERVSAFEKDQQNNPVNKDKFKEFYRRHLAVPLAGFGMAAAMLCIFLLLMTWFSERAHFFQFSLSRFGH